MLFDLLHFGLGPGHRLVSSGFDFLPQAKLPILTVWIHVFMLMMRICSRYGYMRVRPHDTHMLTVWIRVFMLMARIYSRYEYMCVRPHGMNTCVHAHGMDVCVCPHGMDVRPSSWYEYVRWYA